MTNPDLSLISIDDLVKEIGNRCTEFICAYNPIEFKTQRETMYFYGKGSWHRSCALSNQLNNEVLNNWKGELRTLQRLNDDDGS